MMATNPEQGECRIAEQFPVTEKKKETTTIAGIAFRRRITSLFRDATIGTKKYYEMNKTKIATSRNSVDCEDTLSLINNKFIKGNL